MTIQLLKTPPGQTAEDPVGPIKNATLQLLAFTAA
jgi:hypothetical protein